jgi:hypothetical protein
MKAFNGFYVFRCNVDFYLVQVKGEMPPNKTLMASITK